MCIKRLTKEQFFDLFDPSVHEAMCEALKRYPSAIGLVSWEVLTMDSSRFGERCATVFGPDNTFKSINECENRWLRDLPSGRQYPVAYVTSEDILK